MKDEMAESSRPLVIRPMVLPPIPPSLKASWNLNSEKLTKAGMFHFLAWVQTVNRVAYVAKVVQFVQNYSKDTETAQVDGRTIDCSLKMMERILKLPTVGQSLDDMTVLGKRQFSMVFEGDYPRPPNGCRLEVAKPEWKAWFRFINDYLMLRPQKDVIDQRIVMAAMKTLDGEKVNWGRIMQQRMIEEMEAKKVEEAQSVELFAAFYISVLCEEPPTPAAHFAEPSSPRSTPSPLSSPEKSNLEFMENRRLQLRVRNLQAMLDEKQEQLIKKGEVLVEYQTNNVKSLGDLAQAIKGENE